MSLSPEQFNNVPMFDSSTYKAEQPPPLKLPYPKHISDQRKEGPFQHVNPENTPFISTRVNQESLPAGIPVRDFGPAPKLDQSGRTEWVPTTSLYTEQATVDPQKLNDRHANFKGEAAQDSLPFGVKYSDDHVHVGDGNHRLTVERHKGAMFHQMNTYDPQPGNTRPPGPVRDRDPKGTNDGTYSP